MNSNVTRQITILSIYLSLILALTFIPYTGYIQVGPLAITTIPVIIALATYHIGIKGTILAGLAFGIGSYLRAVTMFPSLMVDPMLSIVPRIFMSISIYFVYRLLGNLKVWKFIVLSLCCVLFNSFFVSLFYFIVQLYDSTYAKTFIVWITLIYINFLVEIGVAALISLPLYKILIVQIKKQNLGQKNHYF